MQNDVYENYLQHHGILGQKWGVRRTPEQLGHKTKQSKASKEQKNKKALRTGRRVLKTVGSALLFSASLHSLINSQDGQYNIALGKQFVNSFLKTNGSKKVSDIKPDKDWTWADYAWAEVEKPH